MCGAHRSCAQQCVKVWDVVSSAGAPRTVEKVQQVQQLYTNLYKQRCQDIFMPQAPATTSVVYSGNAKVCVLPQTWPVDFSIQW